MTDTRSTYRLLDLIAEQAVFARDAARLVANSPEKHDLLIAIARIEAAQSEIDRRSRLEGLALPPRTKP